MDSRFGDVQVVSNLAVTQTTSQPAVDRAKNPNLFPKYLHNFTRQIMSFDKACDLVKTAHKIAGAKLRCCELLAHRNQKRGAGRKRRSSIRRVFSQCVMDAWRQSSTKCCISRDRCKSLAASTTSVGRRICSLLLHRRIRCSGGSRSWHQPARARRGGTTDGSGASSGAQVADVLLALSVSGKYNGGIGAAVIIPTQQLVPIPSIVLSPSQHLFDYFEVALVRDFFVASHSKTIETRFTSGLNLCGTFAPRTPRTRSRLLNHSVN